MTVRRYSYHQVSVVLLVLLMVGMFLSITKGPMSLPMGQSLLAIWDGIWGSELNQLAEYQQVVVVDLRLPRTLLAMLVGALMAVSGAVTQGLFRNPLADPGIIGISMGAALGAAFSIVLLPVFLASLVTPVAAFFGALVTTLFMYKMAQSPAGTSVLILLLAGVAMTAFSGAIIGFLTYIADEQSLRDLTLWNMGTLNGATFIWVGLLAITFVVVFYFYLRDANSLNALAIGEPEARHLGIDVEKLKMRLIILTAIGVAVCVSATGIIGFLGLVVPHLVRLVIGPDHRLLLPLSALTGAVLLLIADISARLLMAPAELPVGLMTTLFGAPFFAMLIIQQRKQLF